MSTVLIQAAKTGAETALRVGGQIALQYASSAISHVFDTRRFEGPRLESFRLMSSTDGAPLPRVFGRVRLGGQVIWASNLKETVTEEKVGKGGGPTQVNYTYSISFAVALCEGVIAGVDKIWANGEVLKTSDLTYRVYRGTETQLPDPVISVIDGDVPAYRGTAYLVFEDFPLDAFGGRLPQINAEVIRPVARQDDAPRLEDLVTGVNLLPSSGEFAYHTRLVEEEGLPGAARPINMNNPTGLSDAERAIDQLQDQLPNCRSVSIISSWFGTDLRLGECEIKPGVETRDRIVLEGDWTVGDQTRANAYLVSRDEGDNPVYGGTPSDASLIALIRLLKERGFEVALYPFILMDVPTGNGLPDPYGGGEQATFPWRGRITSIGADVAAQSRAFFGDTQSSDFGVASEAVDYSGPDSFGFRRFILHHAAIAAVAGGVDRFVIGSEMRGMTTSGSGENYPAVTELIDLADQTRQLLPNAKLTYAADWTEYFGHQDGAALTHHLDPLWASPNIDLIGIDAYFPLSDWRQGKDHLDAQLSARAQDVDYLKSNMEGGEGYDWYYANAADREAQIRTPITDPVYRYKDVRHWWASAHYNRTADNIAETLTAWTPASKPLWFSEIGCPAVDHGANQPNVFVDPKSSESFLPYFSSGLRDDLIQRNYLRAFISHYQDDPMVDGLHVWCWDARPFPDFPARSDVWADGPNWQLGHWLNGRMGRVALADIITDLCRDLDVIVDVSGVSGLIEGLVFDRPLSARAALQDVCAAFAIDVIEQSGRLVFRTRQPRRMTELTPTLRADVPITFSHADQAALPSDVRLHYVESARAHQPGLASGARRIGAHNPRDVTLPVVMDGGLAQSLATRMLDDIGAQDVEMNCHVRPDADLRVGDLVSVPASDRRFRITSLEGPLADGLALNAISEAESVFELPLGGQAPTQVDPIPLTPKPALFAFDLPGYSGLSVGAMVSPFRPVQIVAEQDGSEVRVDAPLALGVLQSTLNAASPAMIDRGSRLEVSNLTVKLESLTDEAWQQGGNRFAIETEFGWEIIAARDVQLIGPARYALSHLLRGLDGSDDDMATVQPGARVIYLGQGVTSLELSDAFIGSDVTLTGQAAGRSVTLSHLYEGRHLRPRSPVHMTARREEGQIHIAFIRRSRTGESWAGLNVPIGEESELYQLRFYSDEALIRTQEITSTRWQMADEANVTHVEVAQGSATYGWGAPRRVAVTG